MPPEVIDMATLDSRKPDTPPPFVPMTKGAVANAPTIDEEANIRAIFEKAAQAGTESLAETVELPAPTPQVQPDLPLEQPKAAVETPAKPVDVPVKFQKPDGTVDEEKLKASSEQLDRALDKKTKTIEEILAEYKEKEKRLTELGAKAKELSSNPPAPVPAPIPQAPAADVNVEALRQKILQDFQMDPVGTVVEISRLVARKETEPIQQVAATIAERERDTALKNQLAAISEEDPRILDPENYAVVAKILFEEEPTMQRLKNPYKAAWNEAKERLRLGALVKGAALPSNTPSPMLGRGTPPPVSSLSTPQSPQSILQQSASVNPLSEDGKRLEEALLRQLAEQAWGR